MAPMWRGLQESARHKELAKHRTAAVMKREQDRAAKGNTLDKMTKKVKEGPLLLLRRYYKSSVRLQVVTRHASGPRGTAIGKPPLPCLPPSRQSSTQKQGSMVTANMMIVNVSRVQKMLQVIINR